jgi:signal transduction histidine kinase
MDQQAPNQRDRHRVALDEILEDLIDIYRDRAEQAQILLKSQLISEIEVKADASQLQRLFSNLLVNALQYTPCGGTITVSLQRIDNDALVSVEDTGMGIAADQVLHIFDRFWRSDLARSRCQDGSGLGLAIAKSIAQQHCCDIKVHSELGKGTCFQIKIPLDLSKNGK